MSFQKIKIVGGTGLSLLLFAISGYPAMAQNSSGSQGSTTVNMTAGQTVQGTVVSVVGDTVRMRLASGELRDITISSADSQRLNLQPGTQIVATMGSNGNTTVALANSMNTMAANAGMMSQQEVRGVIRNIVGNVVTLELPNGETRAVTVSQEQRTQLNLQPGMIVTARSMTSGSNGDVFVETANNNIPSTAMISGTVRSVVGDVVTITMPDGSNRDVLISRADINRLNLVPGMEVSVMMNNGTTSIALVNETQRSTTLSTTQPSTINGSTVIEERTTISETTTVAPTTTSTVRARPVRALW